MDYRLPTRSPFLRLAFLLPTTRPCVRPFPPSSSRAFKSRKASRTTSLAVWYKPVATFWSTRCRSSGVSETFRGPCRFVVDISDVAYFVTIRSHLHLDVVVPQVFRPSLPYQEAHRREVNLPQRALVTAANPYAGSILRVGVTSTLAFEWSVLHQ